MKTIYLRTLLFSTFLGAMAASRAQALIIKGHVKNVDKETAVAYYTLANSYETLQTGKCSDLKLKLGYNDCYILTFFKRGCRSKTIMISTFGNSIFKCRVAFNVTLNPLIVSDMQEPDLVAGRIFYDRESGEYSYISYSEKSEKEPEKESVTPKKKLYALK